MTTTTNTTATADYATSDLCAIVLAASLDDIRETRDAATIEEGDAQRAKYTAAACDAIAVHGGLFTGGVDAQRRVRDLAARIIASAVRWNGLDINDPSDVYGAVEDLLRFGRELFTEGISAYDIAEAVARAAGSNAMRLGD